VKGAELVNKDRMTVVDFIQKTIFLRDRPLITKLFVFSALLVVTPMLVIGLISYNRSSQVLQSEARQYSLQIIEQVKKHVEYYVQDFEIDTLKILNHPDMVAFMKMSTVEEVEQSGIRRSIQTLIHNTAYSRVDISAITIILDNFQVVDTIGSIGSYPITELRKEYWYQSVLSNSDPVVIARIIHWGQRDEPVITIAKRLISPYTLKPIGMIITDVNYKRIQEIAEKVTIGRTGYLNILDSQGHYVYHPDFNQLGKKVAFDKPMFGNKGGSFLSKDKKDFFTYSSSAELGWTLVTSVPYKELTQGVNYIGLTIFITITVTLLVTYILGIGFASSLVTPIKRLQRFVKKVESGDFSGHVQVDSRDEIGLLSHGFNKMTERLSLLVEEIYSSKLKETEMALRQRETELKVLQSQMNPHFLFNALETIRGMALEKEMNDIGTMTSSLGRLLRYNLTNDTYTVYLHEEAAFCEVYLRIQKFRFEHKFDYAFLIPEWAGYQSIAKFSLQPLVENCVIHAIESASQCIKLQVVAEMEGDDIYLVKVIDNGEGIPLPILEQIKWDLEQKDIISGGTHIGIVNVHKRIKYLFGEDYGLSIHSICGQGTTVTIRLPFKSVSI
jgi:two-component system sensor histidine kinase YesM